ncbi:hypothetical protein LCGC14_1477760 [marine sediment metagenome]|uniref:Large polyvalent protein associated domain-containing protein n=1 Tax=marine sediment metagenome TaxID=412755 RepID=A0A0F9JAI5_9ZZZZ
MPQDILDAFSQRFARKDALDVVGRIFSTPQHLLTAAFDPNRDYLSSFAKGVDPSELAGVGGVGGFALDVLADPLNLLVGAGLITKLARTGKFVKAARAVNPLDDLARSISDEVPDIVRKAARPLDEAAKLGQGRLRDIEEINTTMLKYADEFSIARKSGASAEFREKIVGEVNNNMGVLKGFDETLGTGDAFQMTGLANIFKNKVASGIDEGLDTFEATQRAIPELQQLVGLTTKAGRGLEAVKQPNEIVANVFNKIMLGSTPAQRKAVRDLMRKEVGGEFIPSNWDKIVEWATMSKLWGISTLVRNTVGNTFSAALQVPEKFAAGVVDAIVSGVTRTSRSVYAREALEETVGILGGLKEAGKNFARIMRDPNAYMTEATKLAEFGGRVGAIKGIKGEIIRAPGRVLTATDIFYRTFLKAGNMRGLATRQGMKEGLRGSRLAERITEIVTGNDKKMYDELIKIAESSAKERIFQEQLTGINKTLDAFRMKHPMVRIIVPFWKTPVNLMKQSFQRVPGLGLFTPSSMKELKKVFPFVKGQVNRDFLATMASRQISGSFFMLGAYAAAGDGMVSGLGPRSRAKRNAMRMAGWQPQSIKLGDKWYSYRGFEPISSWLRAAADFFEGRKEGESLSELPQKLVFSYVKQFSENPFFMGIHDVYEGVSDPETKASDVIAGMVIGSTVPNILQQWNRTMIDPVIREARTLPEKVFRRLPLVSQTVRARRDIFGEAIVRDDAWKSFFGFNVSIEEKSKLYTEIARLGMGVGKPSRLVNGYEMTDEEYDRYYILKGTMLKNTMEKLVESPGYDRMPDETKIKVLRRTISKVNSFTKHQEFEKYYRSTP